MEEEIKPKALLEFWFGGPDPHAADLEERIDFWFAVGPEDDALTQRRFGAAPGREGGATTLNWPPSPSRFNNPTG